jgi:NADPH:quinone reductase-like Zn-dependent oxidoreductase
MKAIVLKEYGDASKLTLQQIAEPTPGPGEIKVKVAAASLNPIDWKLRSGVMKAFMPIEFPHVLGRDVSGEVDAVSVVPEEGLPGLARSWGARQGAQVARDAALGHVEAEA